MHAGEPVDSVIGRLYHDVVGPYWPPERRLTEERYRTIDFPFMETEIEPPPFRMEKRWTFPELTGVPADLVGVETLPGGDGGGSGRRGRAGARARLGTVGRGPDDRLGPRPAGRAENVESPRWCSTRSADRSGASGSRSRTGATCAASTACRSGTTSGCRGATSWTSRRSRRSSSVFAGLGVDRVRLTGGEPLLRRDLPRLVRLLAANAALCRPRADDERRPPRRAGRALRGGGALAGDREPRHAPARALPGARAIRRARPRARRHRGGRVGRLAPRQDRLGRDARRERRRDPGPPRLRPPRRRRGAVHRVHGRRRRDALVARRRSSRARRSSSASAASAGRSSRSRRGGPRRPSASASPTAPCSGSSLRRRRPSAARATAAA